jgi:hypothetical protein
MSAGADENLADELAETRDPVWQLLARAPMPEPEAWFAARTLARVRQDRQDAAFSSRVRRWVLSGALGVSVAVTLLAGQFHAAQSKQQNVQEALQILATVDSDSDATASTSSWQDSSSL